MGSVGNTQPNGSIKDWLDDEDEQDTYTEANFAEGEEMDEYAEQHGTSIQYQSVIQEANGITVNHTHYYNGDVKYEVYDQNGQYMTTLWSEDELADFISSHTK